MTRKSVTRTGHHISLEKSNEGRYDGLSWDGETRNAYRISVCKAAVWNTMKKMGEW
jgi:hypothetical protein